jgi:hypothetical protein
MTLPGLGLKAADGAAAPRLLLRREPHAARVGARLLRRDEAPRPLLRRDEAPRPLLRRVAEAGTGGVL